MVWPPSLRLTAGKDHAVEPTLSYSDAHTKDKIKAPLCAAAFPEQEALNRFLLYIMRTRHRETDRNVRLWENGATDRYTSCSSHCQKLQ